MIMLQAYADTDIYTSMSQLEKMYDNEAKFLSKIEHFLRDFEKNIDIFRGKVYEVKNLQRNLENVASYHQNPIHAFQYLRIFTQFLDNFRALIKTPISELLKAFKDVEESDGWPTISDAKGAARALMRLQNVYNMDLDELIHGKKLNSKAPLSVENIFFIGTTALNDGITSYDSRDDLMAEMWLERAFIECNKIKCSTELRINITEYYAFVRYLKGNLKKSLSLTEQLLRLKPQHERALHNKQYLLDELNNIPASQRSGKFMVNPLNNEDDRMFYNYACQNLIPIRNEILLKLRCRYVHHNNPYLKIGPIKQEEAYNDPKIVIYKDLLFDWEIEELKSLANQDLQRSKTIGGVSDVVRTSKVAWLKKTNGGIAVKINQRFAAYADLHCESSEALQVANYGLGGHYVIHKDAFSDSVIETRGMRSLGNRLATFLAYMNDVDRGGHTVFPYLGVNVKPERGSAVFWYNLHANGSIDTRTYHAACPVITGMKWAINLWFREFNNEFNKPCPLNSQAVMNY